MAYVPQEFELDPYRSVEDCLRLAMSDLNENAKQEFVGTLLPLVNLQNQRSQKVLSLSGGEKQRLADFIRVGHGEGIFVPR